MKTKCVILTSLTALSGILQQGHASIDLGTAGGFAVLGASAVTSTGNTVLNGNLGLYPGFSITGFGPGVVNGTTFDGGPVAQQAQADALAAYNTLSSLPLTQNLTGQDLGGLTLTPGVYHFSTSAQLTGALTLDALGNPNAQFVIQIGSTLTTAASASMVLEGGAQADNVFWQVGTSATVGTASVLYGAIVADASITLNAGADLTGNALALNGAVSLDDNTIEAVPEADPLGTLAIFAAMFGTTALLGRFRSKTTSSLENGGNAV
jgi:type VI secretion system secreted protein VgrG